MASDAVTRDPAGTASDSSTDADQPATAAARWPRSRIYRIAARTVLVLAVLCSAMGLSIVGACFVNDYTISESRGQGVAEVINTTSPLRTVVRFSTDEGRVYIPPGGVLYPQGLQRGQMVRIEYDQRNPDLARVAGRNGMLAVAPVLSSLAVVWAVLLPGSWLLRRTSRRYARVLPARE